MTLRTPDVIKLNGMLGHEHFIFAMKTPPLDRSRVAIPDYTASGDIIITCLSILYGKRFDSHGLVESIGNFWLPDYSHFSNYNPNLPFNSQTSRPDLEISLNLDEIKRIAPLLHEEHVDPRFERFFYSAGRFYVNALQHAEIQPEIAFLNLITCGEILSNFYNYNQDDLLDDEMKRDLFRIGGEIQDGSAIVRRISSRLFSVKRRFIKTVLFLLNSYFFQQSEAKENFGRLNKDDISMRIRAAYDLRSMYVHRGVNFGFWINLQFLVGRQFNNEVPFGEPVIDDPEFKKILVRSPTFIGMERIMRFCLLRFMHLNGVFIDLKLEGKGLSMPEEEVEDREDD